MAIITTVLEFIWGKSPIWLRVVMVLLIGPMALIGLGVAGFMAFDAWLISKVDTAVVPMKVEMRNAKATHDLEHEYIKDKLEGNLQLTKMVYEETLRSRK